MPNCCSSKLPTANDVVEDCQSCTGRQAKQHSRAEGRHGTASGAWHSNGPVQDQEGHLLWQARHAHFLAGAHSSSWFCNRQSSACSRYSCLLRRCRSMQAWPVLASLPSMLPRTLVLISAPCTLLNMHHALCATSTALHSVALHRRTACSLKLQALAC